MKDNDIKPPAHFDVRLGDKSVFNSQVCRSSRGTLDRRMRGRLCGRLPVRSGPLFRHRGSLLSDCGVGRLGHASGLECECRLDYPFRRDRPRSRFRWSGHCSGGHACLSHPQSVFGTADHRVRCSSDNLRPCHEIGRCGRPGAYQR